MVSALIDCIAETDNKCIGLVFIAQSLAAKQKIYSVGIKQCSQLKLRSSTTFITEPYDLLQYCNWQIQNILLDQ